MKNRNWLYILIVIGLVVFISCKRDDENPPNTVKDIDGNVYHTVTIGTQIWMVGNLKTTKYIDGTAIPLITENAVWGALTTPGYCWYNNDITSYKSTYGALYNWYTVNSGKLCPSGWHVPSDAEWKALEMYLGMSQISADSTGPRGTDQGIQLKNITGWISEGNGTNTSEFSALPGGVRGIQGTFAYVGNLGTWWSSSEFDTSYALVRFLSSDGGGVIRGSDDKELGLSVRCLQDE